MQIKDALKAYKLKQIESRKLYDIVLAVLCVPCRRHLLSGFQQFVAKPDRPWFANCVRYLHLSMSAVSPKASCSLEMKQLEVLKSPSTKAVK